jgi:hypothetical protein
MKRSGPKTSERDFRKREEREREIRERERSGERAIRSVINFLKTCAGTPTRLVLSSCDKTEIRI